uniref:Uncharacterized protein n=1 Tax=Globodera rostochiensis TaxID=31243 RepID=A0A914HLL1_GLORO
MASNKNNNYFLLLLNLQFFFCAAHDKHLSESSLYDVLNRAERIEYAKYVEEQSREIRVESIFMKYAKVKVDDLLKYSESFLKNWMSVEKFETVGTCEAS